MPQIIYCRETIRYRSKSVCFLFKAVTPSSVFLKNAKLDIVDSITQCETRMEPNDFVEFFQIDTIDKLYRLYLDVLDTWARASIQFANPEVKYAI